MIFVRVRFVAMLLASLFASVAVNAVAADASCSVTEIDAQAGGGPAMDAQLKPLESRLKRPPMSSWNAFKLASSHDLALASRQSGSAGLRHGKLSLQLREAKAAGGRKTQFSLGVVIDDNGQRVADTSASLAPGDYFLWSRALPGGKGQVVAISCR